MIAQSNDESGEEMRLALNQKNAEHCNSDCVKENVCENKQDEEETKCVNGNEINDKESAVENEVHDENKKNYLTEDSTKNDDRVNDEGFSDGS